MGEGEETAITWSRRNTPSGNKVVSHFTPINYSVRLAMHFEEISDELAFPDYLYFYLDISYSN